MSGRVLIHDDFLVDQNIVLCFVYFMACYLLLSSLRFLLVYSLVNRTRSNRAEGQILKSQAFNVGGF